MLGQQRARPARKHDDDQLRHAALGGRRTERHGHWVWRGLFLRAVRWFRLLLGSNRFNTLGSGETTAELAVSATPVAVAGVTTAVSVAVGEINGCVVLADGSVRCWGDDGDGQTGTFPPSPSDNPSPSIIGGVSGPIALSIGEYHVCGLFPGGTVKCWGGNSDGELGDGQLERQSVTPIDVTGIDGGIAIDAGELDTCVVGNDGRVRCWGYGALGNEGTQSSLPTVVMGLSDARAVVTNVTNGCALRADGSVACWGSTLYWLLGDGGVHSYTAVPVPVNAAW